MTKKKRKATRKSGFKSIRSLRKTIALMEPPTRIELVSAPYQGAVLPLNYGGMEVIKGFGPRPYAQSWVPGHTD